jgi:hypothetical protein
VKGSKAARKKNIEVFLPSSLSSRFRPPSRTFARAWISGAPSKTRPYPGFFGVTRGALSLLAMEIGGLTITRKNNFSSL